MHFVAFLQATCFHAFEAVPADFADVEQTVATWHKFNECTEFENAANLAGVNLVNFRNCNDSLDASDSCIDFILFRSADVDFSLAVDFVDGNCCTSFFLDSLDYFATLTDDSANEFLVNGHVNDAWNVWLVVFAWGRDSFVDELEDVQASFLSLAESLFEDFVWQTVALDVHLGSGDTVSGTSHLEVHIAQVVFVAKNIAEHCVLHVAFVGNQTHSDTSHRLLHLHASVEQSHAACANGSHRRRTVRFENVAHDTHGVGEVFWNHTLEGAVCQVAVTDFTTADAASGLGFASREAREVIVEEEAFVATVEHVVNEFFVELGAECASSESLSFATGEHCRSVRAWQVVGPASDWADFGGLTAIETQAFVENATAHSVALDFVEVALHHHCLFFAFFLRNGFYKFIESFLEGFVAPLLVGAASLSHCVALRINLGTHTFVKFFVVGFVAVFALNDANLLCKFLLSHTHRLDSVVCCLEGCNEVVFAYFVHFTFNHHNIVISCTYHQFHVCVLQLFEGWVDDEFSVDASYAHFGNRFFKRHVAHCDSCRSCEACECIRLVLTVA